MTKESCLSNATAAFKDTNVNVTCVGRPYLGVALGSDAYKDLFVSEKVDQWCGDVKLLSAIATTQPHGGQSPPPARGSSQERPEAGISGNPRHHRQDPF